MIRVGVIDSGGPACDHMGDGQGHRAFGPDGLGTPVVRDRLGHGSAVDRVIRRACFDVRIRHAQVFDDRPVTSAARAAAALDWLAGLAPDLRPHLICLSLGLATDRAILRDACTRLAVMQIPLIAAHPAQGDICYPAGYPDVIAATGDARCSWDDLSMPRPGVLGAWCNSPEQGRAGMGGASIGTARVAGHLAAIMSRQGALTSHQAWQVLRDRCHHIGPERRQATHG